jgi:hypothetical protein
MTRSRLLLALAGATGAVLAVVADRHAQNHYTPGNGGSR